MTRRGNRPGAAAGAPSSHRYAGGPRSNRFRKPSNRVLICVAAVVVALVGDFASLLWPGIRPFWVEFLSDFDYIAIVLGGINFGPKGGLAVAAISGIAHTATQKFGFNSPLADQGELTVFILVGLLAGFFAERKPAPNSASGQLEETSSELISRGYFPSLGQPLPPGLVYQLRTPLASIEGAAFVLEDGSLPADKRRELIGIIQKECQRLERLIGTMDSQQPVLRERTAVDIALLVEEVVQRAWETFHVPGLSIERDIAPALPRLQLDREAIAEAILDVLLHAMKAMPEEGRILVASRVLQNEILIQVSEERPHASSSGAYRALHSQSMGLWTEMDLALAQRILAREGGALRIEQNVESGVTLSVVLPNASGETA